MLKIISWVISLTIYGFIIYLIALIGSFTANIYQFGVLVGSLMIFPALGFFYGTKYSLPTCIIRVINITMITLLGVLWFVVLYLLIT